MPRPKRSKSVWTAVFSPWDTEGGMGPASRTGRTDTLFDSMFVFGHGRYQRLVLMFTKAALFVAFAQSFTVGTDLAPVEHWCRLPQPPDNVSDEEWKNYSIPRDPTDGRFLRCVRYGPPPPTTEGPDSTTVVGATASNVTRPGAAGETREEIACDEWDYADIVGGETVLMHWNMVCQRRWYEQLYRTAYMVGSVASVPLVAIFSHSLGRRPMLRGCVAVLLLSGVVAVAAPSVLVFIVSRFFSAAAASALEVVSFVLLFESTPPAPRIAFCALAICWPMVLAPLYMALAELLALDWRLCHMALLIPSLVLVGGLHATQESSHWLLVHGRFAEARGVALCAARVNDEDEDVVEARLKRVQEALSAPGGQRSLATLYLSRPMFSHCTVFCGCWFLLHLVWHYGLLYQFQAETKWAIIAGNVPVMATAYLVIMHFGRLRPLVVSLLSVALVLAYQAAAQYTGRVTSRHGPRLWRRLLVNASYMMLNVHTVASFPTEVRIAAYSCAFLCGRLGALVNAIGGLVSLVEHNVPERLRYLLPAITALGLASFALLLCTQTDKGFDELVAKPPLKRARRKAPYSQSTTGPAEEGELSGGAARRDDDLRSPALPSPSRLRFSQGN